MCLPSHRNFENPFLREDLYVSSTHRQIKFFFNFVILVIRNILLIFQATEFLQTNSLDGLECHPNHLHFTPDELLIIAFYLLIPWKDLHCHDHVLKNHGFSKNDIFFLLAVMNCCQ